MIEQLKIQTKTNEDGKLIKDISNEDVVQIWLKIEDITPQEPHFEMIQNEPDATKAGQSHPLSRIADQGPHQVVDEDSSKILTNTEEDENTEMTIHPKNKNDPGHKKEPKGRGEVKNRQDHDLSHPPPACMISIGVCGRRLWAGPKTSMITCARNVALCLVVCLGLVEWLLTFTCNKVLPPPTPRGINLCSKDSPPDQKMGSKPCNKKMKPKTPAPCLVKRKLKRRMPTTMRTRGEK